MYVYDYTRMHTLLVQLLLQMLLKSTCINSSKFCPFLQKCMQEVRGSCSSCTLDYYTSNTPLNIIIRGSCSSCTLNYYTSSIPFNMIIMIINQFLCNFDAITPYACKCKRNRVICLSIGVSVSLPVGLSTKILNTLQELNQ